MTPTIIKQILSDIQQYLPADMEQGVITERIKAELEATLEKSGLVSKQEFMAQTAALKRASEKLETLSKQIDALETQIATSNGSSTHNLGV